MGRAYTSAKHRATASPMPTGSDEVLAWVGDDAGRAREAILAEQAKPRPDLELIELLATVLPFVDVDGVRFVAHGGAGMIDMIDFAAAASDEDPMVMVGGLATFFKALLGPREYQRFRNHCRVHQTGLPILQDIVADLMEDWTARPTERSSPSAPGPLTTTPTSKVVSMSSGLISEQDLTREQFEAWVEETRALRYSD